jgi:hypothetical protein
MMVPGDMTEAAGAMGAKAMVVGDVSESRVEKPAVPEEQTTLPEASEGVVRHTIWPSSPQVVPPAAAEEDEVEEIERKEPRPQSVQILRKRGDEVVVVKEEDTTKEMRRLKSTLAGVMKQIEVSTAFGVRLSLMLEIRVRHYHYAFVGDNSDYRAGTPADKEDGAPQRGEQKTQGGDEPHGEKHLEGLARDLEYKKGILSEQLQSKSE